MPLAGDLRDGVSGSASGGGRNGMIGIKNPAALRAPGAAFRYDENRTHFDQTAPAKFGVVAQPFASRRANALHWLCPGVDFGSDLPRRRDVPRLPRVGHPVADPALAPRARAVIVPALSGQSRIPWTGGRVAEGARLESV